MKKSWVGLFAGLLALVSLSFVSAAGKWTFFNVFDSWANAGVFEILLPFLLVFALIFGILTKANILGENKGVHAIVAAAIGLLAVVQGSLGKFLINFSGNLAIAISVLLAAIILLGLFYDPKGENGAKWILYILIGVGILAFIVSTAATFSSGGFVGGNLWNDYGPALITVLIIAGIIWAIIAGSKK